MTTDWLPELTDDDLAVLIEAVVAWESKDSASQMMGDIVGAMVMSRDPASIAAYERKMDEEARKRDREKAVRREQSVLLRAKLLTLRDRRRVERVTSGLQSVDAVTGFHRGTRPAVEVPGDRSRGEGSSS